MEPLKLEDPDSDLVRRVRAIRKAADDANFDAGKVAVLRAEFENLSDEDLKALAKMHLLFSSDAPAETMEGFWLGKRIAGEILDKGR